ncbi:MAG: zinc ribbon domain-containing protein [Methanobacteriaceae archaeon]
MICQKCKTENDDNNKFCRKCGKKIDFNEPETSENSSINPSLIGYLKNNKVLVGIIIILSIIVVSLGAYAYVAVNDNNDSAQIVSENNTTIKESTNSTVSGNSVKNNNYKYIEGVPFYIPDYYTLKSSSNENGVYSEAYVNNRGEELSIAATHSSSASSFASYMNRNGYNFKYDRSRNLYYLSHSTQNGYIFDYNGVTIYIYSDNLDDLHTAYVLD